MKTVLGVLALSLVGFTLEARDFTLRFTGNSVFSDAKLEEVLAFDMEILERDFSITAVDDAAFLLARFYRRNGFADAAVSFDFDAAQRTAAFHITEGREIRITRIEIMAGSEFPAGLLEADFRAALVSVSGEGGFFSPDAVELGVADLLETFAESGFLAATADIRIGKPAPEERTILIQITPGPRFEIREIRFTGDLVETESGLMDLVTDLREPSFAEDTVLQMRARLLDHFRDRGFYDFRAEGTADIDETTGRVDLSFKIQAGPRYVIGPVEIVGLQRTRAVAAARRLGVRPGDSYNARQIGEGIRHLLLSGAFDDITTHLEPVAEGTLGLVVHAQEGRAKSFSMGAGYGSWEGLRGLLRFTDNNFSGSLRELRTSVYGSQKSYGGTVSLTEPRLLNRNLRGEMEVYYDFREQPAFELGEAGGLLSIERPWDRRHTSRFQWGLRQIFDTSSDVVDPQGTIQRYRVAFLSLGHRWDTRPNPIHPTTGFLADGRAEWAASALGGDLDFVRWRFKGSYYIPWLSTNTLRRKIPFSFAAVQGGSVRSLDDRNIPIQERFFNGGSTTVRSFDEDELGPKDVNRKPLGGNSFVTANIETQFPLAGDLYLAIFGDAGTLGPASEPWSGMDFRYAIGLGLRYTTPVATIRVDYGWNPDPRSDERSGAFHFGFGFAF